jgi:hypothetical protein
VDGTIVRADRRQLLQGESVTYDVIWDNGAATRALSSVELRRPQWIALPETRSVEACNELLYQHLLTQMRVRGQQPGTSTPSTAPASLAPLQAREKEQLAAVPIGSAPPAREISARARFLVARFGFEGVAVSTSRRIAGNLLQLAWMDGPVNPAMYGIVAGLKQSHQVARIDLARSASPAVLQSVINYIHETFYAPEELARPDRSLARVLSLVSPEAFHRRALTAVTAPNGHAHSSLAYQDLIRCVFERWDDHRGMFCDVATWRHARTERRALFPLGDREASAHMLGVRSRLREAALPADEDSSESCETMPRG